MKALVLGGTGFVGLRLTQALTGEGHQVAVLNRGQTEATLPPGVVRLRADRKDPASVRSALAQREWDWAFDINGYTPADVKTPVEALEGRVGRYIFCSTTSVYATPADILPIPETHALARNSDMQYALDKIACEDLLMAAWRSHLFPVTILRPPAIYGPQNRILTREAGFFARLRRGRPILVPGNGQAVVHFVHVDDLAQAFIKAAQTGATLGQEYTIASAEAITLAGYVRLIGAVMGLEPRMVFVPPEHLKVERPAYFPFVWDRCVIYSIEKALAHFGYTPCYTMRTGIAMTYQWYERSGLDSRQWDFSEEDQLLAALAAEKSASQEPGVTA